MYKIPACLVDYLQTQRNEAGQHPSLLQMRKTVVLMAAIFSYSFRESPQCDGAGPGFCRLLPSSSGDIYSVPAVTMRKHIRLVCIETGEPFHHNYALFPAQCP